METESKFTARLTRELRACRAVVQVVHQSKYSTPGTPDRIVWHRLWHGLMEIKGARTSLEPHQAMVIGRMRRAVPGSAVVVRAPDRIEDEEGTLLSMFDGTGWDLLQALNRLQNW